MFKKFLLVLLLAGSVYGQKLPLAIQSVAGSATLSLAIDTYIHTGAGTDTWTLPTTSIRRGKGYAIKNDGSAALTLSGPLHTSSDVTTYSVAAGTSAELVYDGARWQVISYGGGGGGGLTTADIDTANEFAAIMTQNTGTGSYVRATSPTLVTPILGTPTSGTLTNATGLPIATGVSGLGTGVGTFLGTPSSANFASALTGTTLTLTQTVASANIQAGSLTPQLLWWKLDNSLTDSSGNSRTGTVTGTTTYVTDIWGVASHAFDFNGSTKVAAGDLLGSPTTMTITGWFKCDSIDASSSSDAIELGSAVALRLTSAATQVIIKETGVAWVTHDTLAGAKSGVGWHHFAILIDQTGDRFKFFLDGICTVDSAWTASIDYGDAGVFIIGQHPGNTFYWHGQLDDIRVYNTALNLMQIKELAGMVPRAAF